MDRKVSDRPPRWEKLARVTFPSGPATPMALLVVPKSSPTLRSIAILLEWVDMGGASWRAYTTRRRRPRGRAEGGHALSRGGRAAQGGGRASVRGGVLA